jgi:hypothetical protein
MDPRRRDLGGVRDRDGEVVTLGGQVDAMESGGGHELAVKERGRVSDTDEGAVGRCR